MGKEQIKKIKKKKTEKVASKTESSKENQEKKMTVGTKKFQGGSIYRV